jgi:exopolysaccharide production protein ExoZ
LAVGGVLGALVALRLLVGDASRLIDFYGFPIVLEFVAGMAIAWVYFVRESLPRGVIGAVALLSLLIFATGIWLGVSEQPSRVIFWGLGAAGLVLACLFVEKAYGWPNVPLLRHLGDASYSTYLSHLFTLSIVATVISKLSIFPWLGATGARVVMVGAALLAGSAIYVCIERPIHDALQRLFAGPARRSPDTSLAAIETGGPRRFG